jgi:hypothetical protein
MILGYKRYSLGLREFVLRGVTIIAKFRTALELEIFNNDRDIKGKVFYEGLI